MGTIRAEKNLKKIVSLLKGLSEYPKNGTGKVEALRGNLSGLWSRQINKKDRLIYSIHDDVVKIIVISMRSHYGDR